MKNSEEAIEKVLAGLRNSNTPAGIERRILAAVQDHVSARSQSGWRRLSPVWLVTRPSLTATKSGAYGVALAAIFVLGVAIPAIHRRGHSPAQSKTASTPLVALPPAASEVAAERAQLPVPASRVRSTEKQKARRAGLVLTRDSVALREMRAPSRPEPPMPLTEQEKLLLRFVQTRSPEELAAINPMKWAARDAEEKAEFEKFFGQSTTGDKE